MLRTYHYYYRQEAVELVLVEKQDIVEKLANSVAWLKQAEDHMDQQTTTGNDFSQVQSQYLAHKVKMLSCITYICTYVIFMTKPLKFCGCGHTFMHLKTVISNFVKIHGHSHGVQLCN